MHCESGDERPARKANSAPREAASATPEPAEREAMRGSVLLPGPRCHSHGGAGVVENLQVNDRDVIPGFIKRGRDDDCAASRALVRCKVLGGRAGQPGPSFEPSHVPSQMAGIGNLIEPRSVLGEDFLGASFRWYRRGSETTPRESPHSQEIEGNQ
jgi:hypothetical protein